MVSNTTQIVLLTTYLDDIPTQNPSGELTVVKLSELFMINGVIDHENQNQIWLTLPGTLLYTTIIRDSLPGNLSGMTVTNEDESRSFDSSEFFTVDWPVNDEWIHLFAEPVKTSSIKITLTINCTNSIFEKTNNERDRAYLEDFRNEYKFEIRDSNR